VAVSDREDGMPGSGAVPAAFVSTTVDYVEKGINPATVERSKTPDAPADKFAEGKRLADQSDCKNCHAVDRQVNGPSFQAIAQRYRSNMAFAVPGIYRKIIYGGAGNWGNSYMTPHPQIREEEAIQMALWILSLGDPPKPVQSLPLTGSYVLKAEQGKSGGGAFVLRAVYRDRGYAGMPPLDGSETIVLRSATLQAETCDIRSEGVGNYKPFDNDTVVLNELKNNAYFAFQRVDLTGVSSVTLRTGSGDRRVSYGGGILELRAGSPHGALLGTLALEPQNGDRMTFAERTIPLRDYARPTGQPGYCDLFFVFRNMQDQGRGVAAVDWIRFD
jgi:cytochrome c